MNFTLIYEGELKSRGNPKHKHSIRKSFHKQLKRLWDQEPLNDFKDLSQKSQDKFNLVNEVNNFDFVPRITGRMKSVAELEILVLQNSKPGSIITNSGDIDNRLKTLLDALKIPKEINELPKNTLPENGEFPFFCLLEDDNLITKLNVRTEQHLGLERKSKDVIVIIHITTKLTRVGIGNLGFA